MASEAVAGGFGVVYPVLKAMEESGRLRRGYFVAGRGATQFARPGALDLLRSLRDAPDETEVAVLAAADPANPYGATLKWPASLAADAGRGPTRTVGATVILVDGALAAYLARGDRQLLTFLSDAEPQRSKAARAIGRVPSIARGRAATRRAACYRGDRRRRPTASTGAVLAEAGFISGAVGFQATYARR